MDILIVMIYKLYRYHLLCKQSENNIEKQIKFIININNSNKINDGNNIIEDVPFLIPSTTATTNAIVQSNKEDKNSYYQIDKMKLIQHLHEYSFHQRGTVQSRISLDILGILSTERNTFNFDQYYKNQKL